MMAHVRLDKPAPFLGQQALQQRLGQPLRKKLVTIVLEAAEVYAWGGEAILVEGASAGEISSVGWSPLAGRCVALGYVRGPLAQVAHAGTPAAIELWGQTHAARLFDHWPPRPAAS